ncbi:hypothetical protein BDN70DRAFT_871469 [Pholiota conissans]|uniref:Uncharacterized protein n=1 Tax=Pholiota conissans TaxID=109636 RepID=A0A9P5ZDF9_9AGAR|nr:hypothetical protein BDN70DRAFT_871469 [Pholiota conissans]
MDEEGEHKRGDLRAGDPAARFVVILTAAPRFHLRVPLLFPNHHLLHHELSASARRHVIMTAALRLCITCCPSHLAPIVLSLPSHPRTHLYCHACLDLITKITQ